MENKICGKCKVEKSIDCFAWRNKEKGTRNTWCRRCMKTYDKERHKWNKEKRRDQVSQWTKEIREWFQEYKKTLTCSKCGDKRWYLISFHHIDPSKKEFLVSEMIGTYSKTKIQEEIEKCIPLCANCHRELHYFERLDD